MPFIHFATFSAIISSASVFYFSVISVALITWILEIFSLDPLCIFPYLLYYLFLFEGLSLYIIF